MNEAFDGGCLCGALRFRAAGEILDAGWCHCRMCQRHGGAPAQAYAVVAMADFALLRGTPSVYASSAKGERLACPVCSSVLAFRDRPASFVSFNIACLDEPARIRPTRHIWTMSRIPWHEPRDGLPRFLDAGETPEQTP